VANSQDEGPSQHPDLLAAVVLHTLVSEARDGMTAAKVALACDRDPHAKHDFDEIVMALEILLEDGLAERETALGRTPGLARESDATQPDTVHKPDAPQEPNTSHGSAILPQPMYRPTRAAIRASELSF
jgi:hypothetical protein